MLGSTPNDATPRTVLPDRPSPDLRGRLVRRFLPPAFSARHALWVLILGFAVEGATEAYQFLERGNLAQGPVEYYTTLATTIFGFYLMFLGFREWHAFYPKPDRRSAVRPTGWRRWLVLILWASGTAMTAVLSFLLGGGGFPDAPFWVAWPIGGLVVLAFGRFFFSLRLLAEPLGTWPGNALGWVAFVWSLGVATVAGLVTGDRVIVLLTEFVSNWVALIASAAPIVVAMSPLFVTYGLMIGAFWPVLVRQPNVAG
jgi:hypothetical protein